MLPELKTLLLRLSVLLMVVISISTCLFGQQNYEYPFQNPALSVDSRVDDLVGRMNHSYDFDIYRIFIDGVPIPNVPMTIDMDFNAPTKNMKIIDLYSKNIEVKDYYLGSTTLKKGKHNLRFELVGQNGNPSGKSLGFDSFRFRGRWNKKKASLR